jgi:hypothetical protein
LTITQPFLAARHGFLLNEDGSFEEAFERRDGLEGRDEGSLSETEVGLFETEDDSSFGTGDGCLFEAEGGRLETEDEGLLETEDESLFEGVDGFFTSDDAPTEEVEEEHCIVENAGFLDKVGVAGLEEGVLTFEAGLGQA